MKNQNKKEDVDQKQNKDTKSRLNDLKSLLDNDPVQIDLTPIILTKDNLEELDNLILSVRQKQFCIEYLKSGNGLQSAIAAGYSKNGAKETASRLLTYDNIQGELNRLQELSFRSNNITKEYVMEQILLLIQDSYNDEKTDRTTITKCFDMLNKMNGHYNDTTQVNIQNNLNEIKIQIVRPTDGD
jgi:hypothetical protein